MDNRHVDSKIIMCVFCNVIINPVFQYILIPTKPDNFNNKLKYYVYSYIVL